MKRLSVFVQLYLMLLLVLIMPVSLVVFYATNTLGDYAKDEVAQSTLEKLISSANAIELMMVNIVNGCIRFSQNNSFLELRKVPDYESLNMDTDNIFIAYDAYNTLKNLYVNDSLVYSNFYVGEDSDYVISSDKGICSTDNYLSLEWLQSLKEESPSQKKYWISRNMSTSTVAEARRNLTSEVTVPVLSYVYVVNSLTNATKGSMVCNISVNRLSRMIQSDTENGIGYILDSDNRIICHQDRGAFNQDATDDAVTERIRSSLAASGYFDMAIDGTEYLCAYYKSNFNNWTYVYRYDLNAMMGKASGLTFRALILIAAVIVFGTVLALYLSYQFFKPVRSLMRNISANDPSVKGMKNEWFYLENVFQNMKTQEEEMHGLLEKRMSDYIHLRLREALSGTIEKEEYLAELEKIFPYHHYMVIFAGVDGKNEFLKSTGTDERNYQFLRLENLFDETFSMEGYVSRSIRYRSSICTLVLNMKVYDQFKVPRLLEEKIKEVKLKAEEFFPYTMTMGISGVRTNLADLVFCAQEAEAAVRHRIVAGKNQTIFWNAGMNESKRYHYPYSSEKRIINLIVLGNTDLVCRELIRVKEQILMVEDISYDNVILIYQQLIGAMIKCLMEQGVNTSRVMGNGRVAYTSIASQDTIDEIEKYMLQFVESVREAIDHLHQEQPADQTHDKILHFLEEHYREDIDYEAAASELGISYSYMRKLVRENTGGSIVDFVNKLRIEEAKKLLTTTGLSISAIAEKVGYHNVQSINRFFKKYEGITPGEMRNITG